MHMTAQEIEHVTKACAYVTRNESELLVFDGPGHDDLQIPKGTVEPGESPREALYREVVEESGLATIATLRHVVTDVWTRRASPPKRYVRHFYHAAVHESRDAWTHTVTGDGSERGLEFDLSWEPLPTTEPFALDLDDYLHTLPASSGDAVSADVAAD